jgi:hypothetical protein
MSKAHKRTDDILYVNSDGTKTKIAFIWGRKKDPVPKGLDITVKLAHRKNRDLKIHYGHKAYKTVGQARRQGLILARGIVDLLNEPLN